MNEPRRNDPRDPRMDEPRINEPHRDSRRLDTADIANTRSRQERERPAGDLSAMPQHRPDVEFPEHLFGEDELNRLRGRWSEIQTSFVDDPRRTVEDADHLVADAVQRLAETFAHQREGLERQWSRNEEVSTEDLRVALQRYRTFFDRLLSA